MRRTRTGKRIELSARDVEIFRLLVRYRYLSSTYVHAFVGGASETRLKERLGDLFHEGFLDRPERQWQVANCRYRPAVHELGEGARRILNEEGIVEAPRTWLGGSAHRQYSHSLMICEILASIELGARSIGSLRFISWSEILAKAPVETRALARPFRLPTEGRAEWIVPDALFGIEYETEAQKTYRFFALEADRGTMPIVRSDCNQTSYLGKLAAYRDAIARQLYKSHWGVPNLLILTVTMGEHRLSEMLRQLGLQPDASASFLFRQLSASDLRVPIQELLSEPWLRAGLSAVQIDR